MLPAFACCGVSSTARRVIPLACEPVFSLVRKLGLQRSCYVGTGGSHYPLHKLHSGWVKLAIPLQDIGEDVEHLDDSIRDERHFGAYLVGRYQPCFFLREPELLTLGAIMIEPLPGPELVGIDGPLTQLKDGWERLS